MNRIGIVILSTAAAAAFTITACGDERPWPPSPWEEPPSLLPGLPSGDHGGGIAGPGGSGIRAAADHVIGQQCGNGGWGWPHASCSATFNNITGPIAMGLIHAHSHTFDPAHLAAAVAGGDFDLTFEYGNGEDRFGAFAPAFLRTLSGVTGDSTYSDHAATGFFAELDAGTYGPDDLDTAGWIAALQAARSGGLINLRPWDLHNLPWVAGEIGTAAQADLFRDAVLDGLATLNNDLGTVTFGEMIGLAGGLRGLALNGTTSFPAISAPDFAAIDGIDNLCDLATALVGFQDPNGSWDWSSGLTTPDVTDEDTQTTAYAVLALVAAVEQGCGPCEDAIAAGRGWLLTMQDTDGGFFSWPGGTHNIEVESEALNAILPEADLDLVPDDDCYGIGEDTVTVSIDMSNAPDLIVGGQFFLEYDNSVLDFMSAAPGDAPFTVLVFESVDEGAGTIDYAVGVPFGDPGTMADTTMATLTFAVLSETCGLEEAISFRAHDPPTRLTNESGDEILANNGALPEIVIDQTAPTIACPPDIAVNADAGGCTATLSFTETFDATPALCASQTPDCWYVDRYAPAAFEDAFFDGDSRLRHGISEDDSAANRPPSFSSPFYNTQGRKHDIDMPVGTTLGIDLYIPADWATSVRRAGLWGTTFDGAGVLSGFPIVGFTSNDPADPDNPTPATPTPRFRIFTQDTDQDPDNGFTPDWIDLGLPAGFVYDEWYRLETTLTPTSYEFEVIGPGGSLTFSDAITFGSQRIGNVIVQAYNFGETYDVHWDNVTLGPTGPVSGDNCAATVTFERSDGALLELSDPFPAGTTTITWTATDDCGNSTSCMQTVDVAAVNDMAVAVELQDVDDGPFTRCITFELFECPGGPPVIVEADLTFSLGLALDTIEVPCGFYDCVTARDAKHTLRRTDDDGDFAIAGTAYTCDFTSSGGSDDSLVGGNLNDDPFIDILDFGIFTGQFADAPGADTLCGLLGFHADVSGNGFVDGADFTFISLNFLDEREANCCGLPGAQWAGGGGDLGVAAGPVVRISLEELRRRGLGRLATGDLNGDGWLDQDDVAAFLNGARP